MGNYENIVKLEEMRRKIDESDYLAALKILDTMDRKKVKNTADLSLMAEIFAQNERYEEAMDLLLKIYQKSKTRKTIYQLTEVCINRNDIAQAELYLLEYENIAPKDFYNYIFRYQIDKLKQESYEKLINTLQILKKTEYIEKWAYELAKLYYKAGMEKECIKECSDIVLWFGEGVYVEKAKLLKAYYSGETDKEKMIEELKRRAMGDYTAQSESQIKEAAEQETATSHIEEAAEQETTTTHIEEVVEQEATTTLMEDSYEVDETDYFTEELKKDVEGILTEEQWYTSNYSEASNMSERELAEQEVEETIYQLLQEEDMDEEDRKAKEISESLGIDLEDIFGDFLHVKSIKKQLIKMLEGILNGRAKSIQIIITGTEKSGKTTLAKALTIFFNKIGKLNSTKVAKIDADIMNGIDVLSKKSTLRDCCLVVENASDLKRATIDQLLDLIQYFEGDLIVILEEDKKNINKIFRECPKLMDVFKNRIHLPQSSE